MLVAFNVIGLADDMTANERRVATAILDHFNRKTGQCDPSLDTLARLLGINKRTVIRAINSLQAKGYFSRDRHGGKFHRNSYTPLWTKYRTREANWSALRRRARHDASAPIDLSPCRRQSCHLDGDTRATQTYLSNQSEETCGDAPPRQERETLDVQQLGKWPGKVAKRTGTQPIADERFHVKATRARDVHQDVAERRWNADLMRRYAGDVDAHVKILSVIDDDVSRAATKAEMARAGGGLALIIERLGRVERRGCAP